MRWAARVRAAEPVPLHHHALLAVYAGDFVLVERAADHVDCDIAALAHAASVVF